MGTPLALLCILAGLLPCLALAAYRWRRIQARRPKLIMVSATMRASCPHFFISAVGLVEASCPYCGTLPALPQWPGVAA